MRQGVQGWCTGTTQRDGMGREEGGGFRMGNTCTPMFIAALFIIARIWKQPRCPSADEWIRKLWYIYIMEYYSAIKKKASDSVLMRWMKLELIIQSEESLRKKNTYIWKLERW